MVSKVAALALSLGLGLVGCGGGGGGDGDSKRLAQTIDASKTGVTSIALVQNNGYVHVKGTLQLELVGLDSAGVKTPLTSKATWSTSDTAIGSISKTGLFTPNGTVGQTTITAAYAGLTQTQTINATNAGLRSIAITGAANGIDVCKNATFSAVALFDGDLVLDYPLTWGFVDSASADLASFADPAKPELSTRKSGTVKVIASGKNNANEPVTSPALEFPIHDSLISLTLTSDKGNTDSGVRLTEGQIATITSTATYRNQSTAVITPNSALTVDKPDIATIESKTGILTTKSGTFAGSVATVTGICDKITQTLAVTVIEPQIESIEVKGAISDKNEDIPVTEGRSVDLAVTAKFENSTDTNTDYSNNVKWSITNESDDYDEDLIKINQDGVLEVSNDANLSIVTDIIVEARVVNSDGTIRKNSANKELKDTINILVSPN